MKEEIIPWVHAKFNKQKDDLVKDCTALFHANKPSIRDVARVIGKLIATFPAAQYGPMFYRSLEREEV